MSQNPRVSVGLPVFNGEQFLAQAIDAILVQSYTDFELIISDNASTDGTGGICRAYAEQDSRVQYYRNERNIGAAINFNIVFEKARGEYFKWAACDDICRPQFLGRCVQVLDAETDVVLAYPRAMDIDSNGSITAERNFVLHGERPSPSERFRYQVCVEHWCYHIFGLIRSSCLRQTRLIDRYVASDRVLLAHLALLGPFREVPEELFLHRQHEGRSTKVLPTLHARAGWFDTSKEGHMVFPSWRLLREYEATINRAPLNLQERLYCHLHLLRWLKRKWRDLAGDVKFALGRQAAREK